MKNLFYKLGTQAAVTLTMLLLVFAPFQSLIAQAQVGALDTTQVTPATTGNGVQSAAGAGAGVTNTTAPSTSDLFGACSLYPNKFSASGCVSAIIYAFTIGIGSVFAYVAAYFFDITIQLSLNGASYGLDFISTSWTTARDLGNMAFLFILLYIAFTIIFKADTSSTKTMLATVILVALLVNFSFFFTRVVIDAGNILSIQFYNAIPAPPISQTIQGSSPAASAVASVSSQIGGTAGGTKDLTAGVMNMLNVQGLLNNNSFSQTNGNFIATILIYIAGAIVLWLLTIAFITNGIKFLVRVVVLWFLIIASPLALIALAVPGMGGYFTQWREMLVKHSFYPVAFMFIFLVLNNFAVTMSGPSNALTSGVFTTTQTTGASSFGAIGASLVALAIRLALVIAVLYIGMKASDSISVKGSEAAGKVGGWFGGKMKSTMLMPARLAGVGVRETLGRQAHNDINTLKKYPSNNWAGKLMDRAYTKGVLAPIAGAKFGTANSFNDVAKARKTEKTDVNNAVRDKENKERIKKATEVEKLLKQLVDLEKKRSLTAAEQNKKNELTNQMEDIKSGIKNFNKREVEALSTEEILPIAHLMSEGQIKAIKDGDKSDKDKEKIKNNWEEKSEEAPLTKSLKKLGDINKNSIGAAAEIASRKASGAAINGDWSKSLKAILDQEHQQASTVYKEAEEDLREAAKKIRPIKDAKAAIRAAERTHATAPTDATQAALKAATDSLKTITDAHTTEIAEHDIARKAMNEAHAARQKTQETIDAHKDFDKNRGDILPNETINDKGPKGTFKASLLP
jgi:hypothetical protein